MIANIPSKGVNPFAGAQVNPLYIACERVFLSLLFCARAWL